MTIQRFRRSCGLVAIAPVAFALILPLQGCLSLKKKFPEKRYYVLEASRPEKAPPRAGGKVLEVRRFVVSAPFDQKNFVYRTGESSYASDFYNEFFADPASILTEQTRLWLHDSGLFLAALGAASHLEATRVLEGRLNALYADYSKPGSGRAVLKMQFLLLSDEDAETRIVFHQEYAAETPLEERSPRALVKGWNEALRRILASLEADLSSAIAERREALENQNGDG